MALSIAGKRKKRIHIVNSKYLVKGLLLLLFFIIFPNKKNISHYLHQSI